MSGRKRYFLLFPFLISALPVFITGRWVLLSPLYTWISLAVLLLIAAGSYVAVPKPPVGLMARRRLVEGAIVLLLACDVGARFSGSPWTAYVAFPLFLIWIYTGYRTVEVLLLFLVHTTLQLWENSVDHGLLSRVIVPLALLVTWIAFAAFYRSQEHKKRRHVTDRLSLYEREASNLESHSEAIRDQIQIDEKKKTHIATAIRERERSFQSLLEILQRTFAPHTVALYLYDPTQEKFTLKDHVTESDRFSLEATQKLEGIFRLVVREKDAVRQVSRTGEIRGLTYYNGVPKVRSVIAVPLRNRAILKGVVILDRLDPVPFSEDETETIELIAEQIAKAMEQAESLHAHFHLTEELQGFYAAVSALNRCLRVEDVVQTLLQSTREMIQYDLGLVIMFEPSTKTNRIVSEGGDEELGLVGTSFVCAPERGLVSWVVKNQAPLYYTEFRKRQGKTPLFHLKMKVPNIYDSVFIVPLQLKGEALGALLFASQKDEHFSKSVRKMIEVTALQAAASLKNARMVDQLEQLATTDGLTGLVNHRTFQEILSGEIERSGRHPAPVSLLLVDIDFFKKFNDEYGHPIGDFVLREIAQVLRKVVRKVDAVARYGGEEFAVILVNTSAIGAAQMATRIVQEVSRSRFQHQGLTLHVSVSIGAATYPDDSTGREELIEQADRALYESKRKGRNRATSYSPTLGKMNKAKVEEKLIADAEDQVRRMVDQA